MRRAFDKMFLKECLTCFEIYGNSKKYIYIYIYMFVRYGVCNMYRKYV